MNQVPPAAHCPFFLYDDYLWLNDGFVVGDASLHDVPLAAHHPLTATGKQLLVALRTGTTYANLRSTCQRAGANDWQLHALMGLLNTYGGLRRRRHPVRQAWAVCSLARNAVLGIRYAPLTRRSAATNRAVAEYVARALMPIGIAGCIAMALVIGTGFFNAAIVAGYTLFIGTVFAGSLHIHERVHVHYLKRYGTDCVVMQSGMRLGLLHPQLPPGAEVRVAMAGPGAAIAGCGILALLCLLLEVPALTVAALLAGSFHMGSFLPWYADGAVLHKAWKDVGRATNN